MLEDAILELKSGAGERREEFTPQINVEAPILIPEAYVPDLDLRMGLYRRLGELEDRQEVEAFGAELIDRFGKLPQETKNLLQIVETKINCRKGRIAKLDVGAKGAWSLSRLMASPTLAGLLAYVDRLKGAAKLRPDSKLVISRDWPTGEGRLTGALQISRGLMRVLAAGETKELEPPGGSSRGGGDEARQLRLVERRGAQKALVKVAAPLLEQAQLGEIFHPSTITCSPSSRARLIIALTMIRSRLPPTISAIIARSILMASSGSEAR